jgi:RNA polymerase subunit RPABC4/transcription elongation factor Spt4|eukprot:CAMPEP_0181195204 /NCGR_PEP_ID=MMETSP1096-20121128/14754_1 /TAXON_ID=156174 ORGANISM="Chrysochromulina ericina, Strain CCMP281" /NCGR_SAMPLE_ID=MMETSP1096 /ASSEMBLY_ACC=CAM_ASM_000453 /LENGTH=77 /DNA_ID=CAMNT_0023284775 /DNA_START=64 /DNA_END=297 /DNA_ORIENTATION=-
MPMPKKKCDKCGAMSSVAVKVCPCGVKFKSKSTTNWAGMKIPSKAISKTAYIPTGRPRGRAPKGKKWDAEKKEFVDA